MSYSFTKAKPAEPTQSPAPSPKPSEQAQELTQEEIERYQEILHPIQPLKDGSTTSSYISCILPPFMNGPRI